LVFKGKFDAEARPWEKVEVLTTVSILQLIYARSG
jgi:hypothetical protein